MRQWRLNWPAKLEKKYTKSASPHKGLCQCAVRTESVREQKERKTLDVLLLEDKLPPPLLYCCPLSVVVWTETEEAKLQELFTFYRFFHSVWRCISLDRTVVDCCHCFVCTWSSSARCSFWCSLGRRQALKAPSRWPAWTSVGSSCAVKSTLKRAPPR